jgi:hypothetical protein
MATVFDNVYVYASSHRYGHEDNHAFVMRECWSCGATQMAQLAFTSSERWLRCVNCKSASVENDGSLAPAALPLSMPGGVEGREAEVWQEARSCLSVGAHMAAVMLCRKILLHVAVGHGLAAEDEKGRTPTFDTAVKHLREVGVITAKMTPWVDRIREIGNDANHQLGAISPAQALDVAKFTEQLLRLAYEMDALMVSSAPVLEE